MRKGRHMEMLLIQKKRYKQKHEGSKITIELICEKNMSDRTVMRARLTCRGDHLFSIQIDSPPPYQGVTVSLR